MSDQPESVTDDLGSYSLDDEDQLQSGDTLVGEGGDDVLEAGYSPPDHAHGSLAHGVTAAEQARDETIEERIQQEVPEEGTAYGAPVDDAGLDEERVGGDDPDSISASDDWLGDDVADQAVGRLVAPDEGAHGDMEADLIGTDVGLGGDAASAEEAAMHVVDDPERLGGTDGLGDVDDLGEDPDAG